MHTIRESIVEAAANYGDIVLKSLLGVSCGIAGIIVTGLDQIEQWLRIALAIVMIIGGMLTACSLVQKMIVTNKKWKNQSRKGDKDNDEEQQYQ